MNKVLLTTTAIAALALATSATAADMAGEISLDFTENASGDIVATPGIEMGIAGEVGVGSIGLIVDNADDTVKIDSYSLGVIVGEATVSFGDQGDLLEAFEGSTEAVGGQTLTDLDDDGESIMVNYNGIGAMVGFKDITADMSEVKNIQVTAGTSVGAVAVAGGVDWNKDTEDFTVAVNGQMNVSSVNVGGTVTYTDAMTGYEVSAGYGSFGAFVNGDKDDMLQNVGGGYYGSSAAGPSFYAEAGYNIDAKELTPAAGITFKF